MSSLSKPAASSRSRELSRTSPWAHGQALMPVASTPTTRRVESSDAAARPISETSSCVRRPVTGVRRSSGYCATIELLDQQSLLDHDLLDCLLEQFGEARHVNALLRRIEIDRAVDVGRDQLLALAVADPDRLADAADSGPRQSDPHVRRRGLKILEKMHAVAHRRATVPK